MGLKAAARRRRRRRAPEEAEGTAASRSCVSGCLRALRATSASWSQSFWMRSVGLMPHLHSFLCMHEWLHFLYWLTCHLSCSFLNRRSSAVLVHSQPAASPRIRSSQHSQRVAAYRQRQVSGQQAGGRGRVGRKDEKGREEEEFVFIPIPPS